MPLTADRKNNKDAQSPVKQNRGKGEGVAGQTTEGQTDEWHEQARSYLHTQGVIKKG